MTVLAYVVGVLALVLGVGASIALHELGHLVPAKRFGVRVPQYMVGFGPTLWSTRRGETEYGIKAIPLGGYVRMIGMFPPRRGDEPGTVRVSSTGRWSQLADEARTQAMEELRPGDENRVFYKLPVWQKLVVMSSGVLVNLLIATVLITLLVTVHGIQTPQRGAQVASLAQCVVPADQVTSQTSCEGKPPTPAYAAGIRPGDRIVEVDGHEVVTNRDVGRLVRPRIDQPTQIVLERGGERVTVTATPIRNTLARTDERGRPVLDSAGKPVVDIVGFLGISSSTPLAYEAQPLSEVPGIVGAQVWRTATAIVRLPEKMVGVWQSAFGGQARDVESPMSVVGVGRIAGETASGRLDALIGPTWGDKAWFLVSLLASLNLMLFALNLVPLMPFDGGQAAGALWEGVKRRGARLLRRPDPGYVDVAKALPVTYAVSSVLIVMTLLLIYVDVVNPIKLG